jgi:Tol biopolymer transport system component
MPVPKLLCILAATALTASAGEAPPEAVPLTEDQIKAELVKESPEQKALRAELEALAKAGQKIYFNANLGEGNRNEILVMGPDGSGVKQLTKDGGDYPHTPADGSVVYFASQRVSLVEPMPEALKGVPFNPKTPPLKWAGEGINRMKGTPVVWSMKPDGGDLKPVAFGSTPHVSPDGKLLAYCTTNPPFSPKLFIMDLEKKTEAAISHPALKYAGMQPCFSPDGNYVIGANGGGAHCVKLNAERNGVGKVFKFDNGHPCNGETSPDGKYWAYVVDTDECLGGWLCYRNMDYEKPGQGGGELPLQHKRGSVNYYPAFSPDGKYLVYVHAEHQAGIKSWELKTRQEVYVTRFPKCEATVRVTWNGAGNQHPHWWGPAAK